MPPSSHQHLRELKQLVDYLCHDRWSPSRLRLVLLSGTVSVLLLWVSCAVSVLLLSPAAGDDCEPAVVFVDSATTVAVCRYEKAVKRLLPMLSCSYSESGLLPALPGSRPFAFLGSITHCAQSEPELTIGPPLSFDNATASVSVSLPVNATALLELLNRSRASVFGLGQQELFDPVLRRSRELPASQLQLSAGFSATLDRLTSQLWGQMLTEQDRQQTLQDWRGFESPHHWRLELHKLIVYGKGDRFAPHRDSYKAEGHVATVVALLPTTEQLGSQGGRLRVMRTGPRGLSERLDWEADGAVRAAEGSSAAACGDAGQQGGAASLSWAAFYCDCLHEVEEVTSGYRVALLLNFIRTLH